MMMLCVLSLLLITVDGTLINGLEEDFPLATGKEAAHATARIAEFFNAVLDEQVPLPSDMPSYYRIPTDVQFTCNDKLPGYYADVNYGCQVYHMCREDPVFGVASFLCPNTTIFDQATFACNWWFNVDCVTAPTLYHLNENIYKDPEVEEDISGNHIDQPLQPLQVDVRVGAIPN